MDHWNSFESVPAGLDLSNVTKLSLSLSYRSLRDEVIRTALKSLLRQTPNLQSLEFSARLSLNMQPMWGYGIYDMIAEHVDPSKLRHLTIPADNAISVHDFLRRFSGLASIKLNTRCTRTKCDQLVKNLREVITDYSIEQDYSSLSIEMYRRAETTNVGNKSKKRSSGCSCKLH